MAPRTDYIGQNCSVARALEVVGERWTLLILRDAFYGVRRFGDFASHLEIPRAVLSSRLRTLVEEQVLARVPGPSGHDEYELTGKGTSLWTVVRELMVWGDRYYSPTGPRRILLHAADDGVLDEAGRCGECGELIAPGETVITPGPGIAGEPPLENALAAAFRQPRRVLHPIRPEPAR